MEHHSQSIADFIGNGRFSHARYHNQYALLMAMSTVEGLRRAMPQKRTFVLSRAGSAGIQRYAANWLGDNCSRWDHLAMSVPMALGFGVSGQAFLGADLGGFAKHTNAELFLRWIQCGVLTPFCRNHSNMGNREFHVVFRGASPVRVRVEGERVAPQEGRFVLPNEGSRFLLEGELSE